MLEKLKPILISNFFERVFSGFTPALMSEHHPDKLVAKGLPPEMMEMAKQKAQEIQQAYELIKQQKGFK